MLNEKFKKEIPLHLMILPGFMILLVFSYLPMAGIIIAFEKFIPAKGLFGPQKWIGLDNFKYVMELPNFGSIIWNTVFISVMKIILLLIIPIIFAILINEVTNSRLKRTIFLPKKGEF